MNTKDLSFVVQGAIDGEISPLTGKPTTASCLESLRRYHPGAELILSTWRGQPLDGLDYDQLVLNEDPGAFNAFRPEAGKIRLDNTNRQIVSARNGLRSVTRKYAAKVRSDMIFTSSQWLEHCGRYPARGNEWSVFKERVITCSMFARDPRCPYTEQPLHPPDWMHIGLTEDIQLLWDIPLQPEPESSQWFLNREIRLPPPPDWDIRRFSPEQYLWRTLLMKFGTIKFEERGDNSTENTLITELSFANNLIILDPDQFAFSVYKYPYPMTPTYRYCRFIRHKEWLRLYHLHSEGSPITAAALTVADPAYYVKRAYKAAYSPLQLFRKLTKSPHRYAMHP